MNTAKGLSAAKPIGIFDSGPGGLAVLKEVHQLLPNEDVLYFGDTARQPYGPREIEEVEGFVLQITQWLIDHGVKLVIIACNTASVAGRDASCIKYPDIPILGMIEPAVAQALSITQNKQIGVWGTHLTIISNAYEQKIREADPAAGVHGMACPDLLRLAEKGQINNQHLLKKLADKYYQPLTSFSIDTLILGCTDLTCIGDIIKDTIGPDVNMVDPATEVVRRARHILSAHNALNRSAGRDRFFITGRDSAGFARFASKFLGRPIADVTTVDSAESMNLFPGIS